MASEPNNDIELLERILLKLALTEDDKELEATVGRFLVPVLYKLSSPQAAIQKKVLEVLTHINKRVKPHVSIQLPLEQLLDRFLDPNAAAAEKNFAMIYLDMGLERSPLTTQQFILFTLLSRLGSMSNSSPTHVETTLQLFLATCDKFKLNKDLVLDAATKTVLLDFIYDVLLYVPLSTPTAAPPSGLAGLPQPEPAPATQQQQQQNQCPAGLSDKAVKRVTGAAASGNTPARFASWKVDDWAKKKAFICSDFLLEGAVSGIFTESEVFVPLLIAAGDGNAKVQRAGEDALKRLPRVMLEERAVVDKLYLLVTGTASNAKVEVQDKRQPASNIVRIKAFEQLIRSQLALNSFPLNLQATFESLFGPTTNPRLKMQGLGFVQAVIRQANDLTIKVFGPVVLNGALLKMLRELTKEENSTQNAQLRAGIYQSIGALSKKLPNLFSANIELLKEFFESLSTETEVSVRVTLQEALADLSAAFALKASSDPKMAESLQSLLLATVDAKSDVPSRYLSVFYANRLFPFGNPVARHINLICASDIQRQVSDEAKRGLTPFKCVDNSPVPDESVAYPDFTEFMTYISSAAQQNRDRTPKGQPRVSFNMTTFKELLDFARLTLQYSVDKKSSGSSSEEFLSRMLSSNPQALESLRQLILEALAPTSAMDLLHSAAKSLLDLFCLFPSWSAEFFVNSQQNQDVLITLMGRGRPETRRLIAKCISIYAPKMPRDALNQLIRNQLNVMSSGRAVLKRDEQLGACMTLGAVLSRCIETQLAASLDPFGLVDLNLCKETVMQMRVLLDYEVAYAEISAEAIGFVGRFAPLPVAANVVEEIILSISKHISTPGVTTEAVESMAVALGNLTLGDRTLASNQSLLDAFYSTAKIKQEELHFTVGEALACVSSGWLSTSSADPLLPASLTFPSLIASLSNKEADVDRAEPILNKLMELYILGDRADFRAAATIWLLCLLKSAGSTTPAIKKQLKRIQTAFTHLLAENNEVIQEAASKGIVLVYELGDANVQNSLIDTLVSTLQSGSKGLKMTEDTEILPSTSENSPATSKSSSSGAPQLSTYKELLSLASEMNQPDLVYRFMNLSTHHAVWNSKKGAAFATKTLAAKAQEKLKPQLPELIPKLFRCSYDPNPKIAASMTNILNSLVQDTKEITAAESPYFSAIMKDLIENMFNKQWRTREASCLALTDVIASKTFAQVGPFLSDLWERCFKVLDDIKETVRKAAEQLCKSLSSLTLRLCDPSYTNIEDGRRAVDVALPFLLKRGLVSEVKPVRYLAVSLIQKISKAAGFLLKPHISVLVETMLESLTALEPSELNYLSLNADKAGIKQDDIDAARMELSKLSPVNDTLDFCLKQVDKDNIAELAPKLSQTLTSAIGIASRMGAAQFVTQLALRKPEEAALAAPTLLPALRKGAVASNKTSPVRKAFANALGQMARVSGAKKNLLAQTVTLLLDGYKKAEGDDSNGRIAAGEVILELCRSASGVLQPFYKEMVPVIFLARYDTGSEDARKLFSQIWDEIGASIGLYLTEVTDLLVISLDDSRWTMKQQAATAVSALAELVNDYQMKTLAGKLLKTLSAGLRGRIWTGKESFFDAIAKLCESCKNLFYDSSASGLPSQEEILKAMLIEARKKNMAYKKAAIIALGTVLSAFTSASESHKSSSMAIFLQVQETLMNASTLRHDLLEEAEEGPTSTSSSTDATPNKEVVKDENASSLSVRMNAIKALASAWPFYAPAELQTHFESFVTLLRQEMDSSPQFTMRIACLNALKTLLPKLDLSVAATTQLVSDTMFASILESLLSQIVDPNYSSVRSVGVDVLYELVSRSIELKSLQTRGSQIRSALEDAVKRFSASVGAGAERILDLLAEDGYPSKRAKNL